MTKRQTLDSYESRLNRVADYLYAHLDEDLRPEKLAEIACPSPYHWHRIWTAMRGETLGAAVRRLRLLRAADRLANSNMPMAAIASVAGYGSSDAFARAFNESYGQTRPTIAREAATWLSRRPRKPRTRRDFLS